MGKRLLFCLLLVGGRCQESLTGPAPSSVALFSCLTRFWCQFRPGQAMSVAEEYIKTSSDGRSLDTPVLLVTAGCEPPMFTQHFRGWDASIVGKDNFVDPYEAKLAEAKEAKVRAGYFPLG